MGRGAEFVIRAVFLQASRPSHHHPGHEAEAVKGYGPAQGSAHGLLPALVPVRARGLGGSGRPAATGGRTQRTMTCSPTPQGERSPHAQERGNIDRRNAKSTIFGSNSRPEIRKMQDPESTIKKQNGLHGFFRQMRSLLVAVSRDPHWSAATSILFRLAIAGNSYC